MSYLHVQMYQLLDPGAIVLWPFRTCALRKCVGERSKPLYEVRARGPHRKDPGMSATPVPNPHQMQLNPPTAGRGSRRIMAKLGLDVFERPDFDLTLPPRGIVKQSIRYRRRVLLHEEEVFECNLLLERHVLVVKERTQEGSLSCTNMQISNTAG